MSAGQPLIPGLATAPVEDAPRIAAFLQRFAGVSTADFARAIEWQRQGELRFSEAVRQLGLATPAMIDAAVAAEADAGSIQLPRPAGLLRLAHDPLHPHSERIRALRTELLMRQPQGAQASGQATVIASHGTGEGRSLLAAELAVALAQLDQPTLLVDADLRRPAQHQLFSTGNARGLSQLAAQPNPFVQVVEGLPQLALVTAGPVSASPQDILAGARFGDWLRAARQRYRHIVLDSPAASGNADALALAAQADAVLPLARLHHTPLDGFKPLLQRLRAGRAGVLGAVLMEF